MTHQELVEAFSAKAVAVNAVVQEVPTMAAALQYIVDVCADKAPAELLADEPGTEQGPLGPNKVPTRVKRVVAAPQMAEGDYAALAAACEEKGFLCIREGLRNYLAGIDVGVSTADLGVAASGTCMAGVRGLRVGGLEAFTHLPACAFASGRCGRHWRAHHRFWRYSDSLHA